MSKVVKGVFKAVGKVIKGVTKVVKGVVKGVGKLVSKIAGSKLGKILLMAATVYFGGAAIMGAMKGAAAGSGFMGTISGAIQGAGAGISSAWTGLTNAASAFASGNISGAGSAITEGFMGAGQAATNAVTGIAGQTASSMPIGAGVQSSGAFTAPVSQAVTAGQQLAPLAQGGGLLQTAAPAAGGFWNSYGGGAAIMAGSQLAGGLIQGAAADQAAKDEYNRYNTNVGTRLWGDQQPASSGSFPSVAERMEADRQERMQMINNGMDTSGGPRMLNPGLISQYGRQPTTLLQSMFPTYNPYYTA